MCIESSIAKFIVDATRDIFPQFPRPLKCIEWQFLFTVLVLQKRHPIDFAEKIFEKLSMFQSDKVKNPTEFPTESHSAITLCAVRVRFLFVAVFWLCKFSARSKMFK